MWIRSLRAVFFASSDENALLASAFEERRVRLKLFSVVGKEVIELIHEEIDKEISGKSVNIAVRMLKPELDQFMKGLNMAVQAPAKTMMTARIMTSGPASMRALTSAPGAAQTKLPRAKGTASIKR